jgi:hypothetical protein
VKLIVFTVEEANRLLPEIRPRLERLVESKREFDRVQTRLSVLELAVSGADPGNPDVQERHRLHERRNQVAGEISRGVTAIHRRGCLVKDLDRGLVDFYALAGDHLVFLCWQLGEVEVGHWHRLEGGFAQRQPLHRTELE